MASAWGSSWGAAWGNAWGLEGPPVIASLVLGSISIRPAFAGLVHVDPALGDIGATISPMLTGRVSTNEGDD